MSDHQTPEEMQAHLDGPVAAGWAWLHAVTQDADFAAAWRLSDDEFRLARSQAWLWNNRGAPDIVGHDLDEMAAAFAQVPSVHPLGPEFSRMEVEKYQETWAHWDLGQMGTGSRPRPVDVDFEIVLFMRSGPAPVVFSEPTLVESLPFLMHFASGRWLIAHAGSDRRVVPGWPPDFAPAP